LPKDPELQAKHGRWQKGTSHFCMDALRRASIEDKAELKCSDQVKMRVLEMVARETITTMTPEERTGLLDKNAKKVQIFRALPNEGRVRYLERMCDEEKIELMKSELLLLNVMQAQQKANQAALVSRANGKLRAGTEFKTVETVKTINQNQAAIAKNSFGRVLQLDNDGDLQVHIPSKGQRTFIVSRSDLDKLRVTKEGHAHLFEGQASHAAFGGSPINVHITLTSSSTGVWSMLGQTAHVNVDMDEEKFHLFDEDTRFVGRKNADGHFEGTVIQDGDDKGHFVIRAK